MSPRPPTPPEKPLLSVRSALILLMAILSGIGAGILTHAAGQPWPTAVLAGAGATGMAIPLFRGIIG